MKKIMLLLTLLLYSIEMLAAIEYTDSVGLKYRILSVEKMTCALIGVESKEISGELIIPSTSSYAGHDFSVVELEYGCLRECKKLTSVILPSSVTVINEYCFSGCSSLASVTLPQSLKKILKYSFSYCSSLTSITLPSSVTEISREAFYGCDNLRNVRIDEASEGDTILLFTTDISYIKPYNSLFSSAEEVYLGRRIINLSDNGVPGRKFQAPKLKKLVLGGNVMNWYVETDLLGSKEDCFSFYYFESLERLECQALTPPYIPKATDALYMNLIVSVPQESLELYKNADVWKSFWNLEGYSSVKELYVDAKGNNRVIVYNLQGVRMNITNREDLQKLTPGVYVVNGKKIFVNNSGH